MVMERTCWIIYALLLTFCYLVVITTAQNLSEQFLRTRMYSHWKIIPKIQEPHSLGKQNNIMNYLSNKEGNGFMMFSNDYKINSTSGKIVTNLLLKFFNPKYVDAKIIQFHLPLQQHYDNSKDQWCGQSIIVKYELIDDFKIQNQSNIKINFVVNKTTATIQIIDFDMNILIEFGPRELSFTLPAIAIVFNLLLHYFCRKFIEANILFNKISVVTLYHTVIGMMFFSIFQILMGIDHLSGQYSLFLISGFLTAGVALRLINMFQDCGHRLVGLNAYLIFYVALFGYLWALMVYGASDWLILINACNLVPQIAHNIRNGNKLRNNFAYLFLIVSNNLYFLYLKGYSQNVLNYQPNMIVCVLVIILVGIQISFIYLQNKFGPLFFVPKILIYGHYNYLIEITKSESNQHQQCAICLSPLGENPLQKQNNFDNSKQIDISKEQSVNLIKTPCGHLFHKKCLQEWMEYQKICPMDRNILPFIII